MVFHNEEVLPRYDYIVIFLSLRFIEFIRTDWAFSVMSVNDWPHDANETFIEGKVESFDGRLEK